MIIAIANQKGGQSKAIMRPAATPQKTISGLSKK